MKTFLRITLAAVLAMTSLALAAPGAEARVHHRHHHAAPAAHHQNDRHGGRHHGRHAKPTKAERHGHHRDTAPARHGRHHARGPAARAGGGCRTVLVNHHWTKRC